jgi:hypothetical protein
VEMDLVIALSKLLKLFFSFGTKSLELVISFRLRSLVAMWRTLLSVVRIFGANQV